MIFFVQYKSTENLQTYLQFLLFPNPMSNFSDNTQGLTGCLILFFMCSYVPVFE